MADSSHCRHRCAQLQCQQTAILFAPHPGGEIIRQGSVGEVRAEYPVGRKIRHKISRLRNRSSGPQPHRLFSLRTQSILKQEPERNWNRTRISIFYNTAMHIEVPISFSVKVLSYEQSRRHVPLPKLIILCTQTKSIRTIRKADC